MDDDPQGTDRPEIDETAAGLEGALEAAYGGPRKDVPSDASVLIQLEKSGVHAPRVLLQDTAADEMPVVRPGTRETPGGRYQTVGEVARGGVGVILKCRDVDLGRDVAMKVLQPGHADNEILTQRFIEEAQIGGQLQHPGIVPVYELGLTAEKRPYFTMKFVKGKTLAAVLSSREDPSRGHGKLLAVFQQVCMTLGYAHSRGVIHRDLKPANVIIGSFGEVMTVDWGFAKVLAHGGVADERKGRSRRETPETIVHTIRSGSEPGTGSDSIAGSIMGTPAYMPPEQALGDVDAMDSRSDVFGLGAILCEILTGLPPYAPGGTSQIVQAAQGRLDSAFERLDTSGADEALVALCKRCLDPDPTRRPEDAGRVGRAVEDHLQRVEDRAHAAHVAATAARRTRKWAVAASMALLTGLGTALVAWRETDAQRDVAEAARATVEARNQDLELVSYSTSLRRATDAIARGDLEEVSAILAETDPRHRGFEFEWLGMQGTVLEPRIIDTGGGIVQTIELSPDSSVVAVATTASNMSAWNVSSGEALWRDPDLGHSLAWTPDGRTVAALHIDGRLTLVDARTGKEVRSSTEVRRPAYRLAMSNDGRRMAVTSLDGWVSVWSTASLTREAEFEIGTSVRELCWSPDDRSLLVAMGDRAVVLDAETGEQGRAFTMAARSESASNSVAARPLSVAWSKNNQVLVCFVGGGSAVWDAATGRLDHELETHTMRGTSWWEALSGRFAGRTLAVTTGRAGRVRIHDLFSGKRRALIRAHGLIDGRTRGVRWHGPGAPLITWGAGDRLFVWNVEALGSPQDVVDLDIACTAVPTTDAGSWFYVTSAGTLERHDRTQRSGAYTAPDVGLTTWVGEHASHCCCYLPRSNAVVVVNRELKLTLVEANSGRILQTIEAPAEAVTACRRRELYVYGIDASSDETRVACAVGTIMMGRDRAFEAPVLVYQLDRSEVGVIGQHAGSAFDVAFLPDGEHVVSGGLIGRVMLWDARRAVPWGHQPVAKKRWAPQSRYVASVAVSSDGRLVAAGSLDGWVRVYDIETGQEITAVRPIRLREPVQILEFEQPGRRILAIGSRGSLALIDISGPDLLRTSLGFAREYTCIVSGDRSHLLATRGGTVQVRRLRPPKDAASFTHRWSTEERFVREGQTAAFEVWARSVTPLEVRQELERDDRLPEEVRRAALAHAAHAPENIEEVERRLLGIVSTSGEPPMESADALRLARKGLELAKPGSATYGAFLGLVAVGTKDPAAANQAEAVLAAHEKALLESEWISATRAILAARQGRSADARKHLADAMNDLDRLRRTQGATDPALWAEARAAVQALGGR